MCMIYMSVCVPFSTLNSTLRLRRKAWLRAGLGSLPRSGGDTARRGAGRRSGRGSRPEHGQ